MRADLNEQDQRCCDRIKCNFDRAKGVYPLTKLNLGQNILVEDANKKGTVIKKRNEPRSYDVKLKNCAELCRNRKSLRRLPSCYPDWPESKSLSTPQPTPRRGSKVEPFFTPPSSPKTLTASKIHSQMPKSTYPLCARKSVNYGSPE